MTTFEVRPANASDLLQLMNLDHSCQSDYVWQLELRREVGQITASFREVRLPRSIKIGYPRDPRALADEWTRYDAILVAIYEGNAIGYTGILQERAAASARVTDLVVAPEQRRKGAGSAL